MSSRKSCIVLALLLGAAPAAAASWSLGTQFGIATMTSTKSRNGSSTVVGWPANALTYEPGLRLAVGNATHTRDVTLDTGWFLLDEAGSTLSLFTSMASYQHVFKPQWYWSPLANAGAGFYREDAATVTHTSVRFGLGAGIRHAVRDGHGALRVEARYDHLDGNGDSGRPGLDTKQLRFGFDLWF
jgi:hypothetical protein